MGSIPALEGHMQMDKPSDLASRPSTSHVPNDVASTDMAMQEKDEAPRQCKHFSIRGFANEMLEKDARLCSPFIADVDSTTSTSIWKLEPIKVPRFRYWACRGCIGLDQRTEEGTSTSIAAVPGCDDDGCYCKVHFAPETAKASDSVPVRLGHVGEASTSNGSTDNRNLSKTVKACANGVNNDADQRLQASVKVTDSAVPEGNGEPTDKSCGLNRPRNGVLAGEQNIHLKTNALANSHQSIELPVNSNRNREVSAAGLANEVGSSIDNAATPGRLVPLPDLNASDDASPGDADDEPPSANDICDEEEEDSECTPDGKGPKVRSLSELLAVKEDGIIEQAGKGIVSHVVDSSSMDFPGDVSVSKICGSSSKRKKKKNNDLDEEYKPLEVKGSSSIHGTKKARTVDTEPQRTHQTVELSDSELDQDVSHPTVGTKRRAKHTLDGESNPEKKTKKIKHSDEENHMISKNPSLQDPEGGAPRLSTGSWINQYLRPSVPAERDSASSVITTRTFQDGKVPTSLVSWNDWQGGTSSVTVSDAQLRQLSTFDSSVQISQNSSVRTPTHQFPMHCFTAGNYSASMRPVAAVRDYVGHDQGIQERPNARGKEKSAPQLGAGTPLVHHGTSPAVHHRVQIDINALPMEDKGLEQEVVEMMAQNQYERMQGDVGVGPSRMLHLQQHQHPGNTPYNRENGINGGFTMRQKEIIHVAELGRVNVGSTVGHPKENPPSIRLGVSGQRQQNPPLSAFGPTPSNWNSNMQRQGGSHNYLWGMDHIDKYNPAERERSLLWPHMMVSRLPVGNGEHHIQNSAQKGKSKQGSKQQSTLLDFSGVGLGKQNTNFSRSPNINQPESSGVAAAAAKRKGTVGPVNLYSNDTIPAMQLLDLMHNGGMQSKVGTPYRVPRNSEPFVRNSSFHPGSEAHRTGSPNPRVPSVVHDSQASRVNLQEKGCTTCTSALSIVSSFASAFQNMNAGYNAAERNSGCLASGPLVIQDQQWNVNSSHDARSQRFRLSPGTDSGRRNHQLVTAQQDGRVIAGTTTFSKGKGMAGTITSGKGKAIAGPSIAVCPPPTPLAILNPANMVGSGSQQGKRRSLPTPNTNNCVLNRNPAEFTDYNLVKSYMRGPDDFKGKRKSKLERPPRPKIVGRRPNKKQMMPVVAETNILKDSRNRSP